MDSLELGLLALGVVVLGTVKASAATGTRVSRTSGTGYVNGRPVELELHDVGNGQSLRADAAAACLELLAAARAEGFALFVRSGFRTWDEQKALYQAYKAGTGALAAPPGYSNHQQGRSVDLGGVGSFTSTAYSWLTRNAARFGFRNDVASEYWHWTYTPPQGVA